MSSAPAPEEIWKDARWLAQAVDPRAGLVRLVEMTPETYREASFLDDRMFQQKQRTSHLLPWGNIAGSAPADARRDARWIFHISHVGSTLIARLLGELHGIVSVREPRALRDLTFFPPDVRARFIPTIQALFSRAFEPDGAALIKATAAGVVTQKLADTGEQLAPLMPVVVVTDLDNAWANLFVPEPMIPRITIGQTATVLTDAGDTIQGRVSYISPQAEFTPRNVQTADERSKLVYRIKVNVDNRAGILKVGMPVDAELSLP